MLSWQRATVVPPHLHLAALLLCLRSALLRAARTLARSVRSPAMPGVQRQGCKDHRSKRTIGAGRARAVEARQILARTLPGDSICKLRIGVPPKPNETSADRLPAGELTDGEPLFPGDSDVDQLRLLQRCLGRLTPGQMMAFSLNPNNAGVTFDDLPAEEEGLAARYAGKMSALELDFVGGLLTMNPKERATGEECLRHPYLAEHDRAED